MSASNKAPKGNFPLLKDIAQVTHTGDNPWTSKAQPLFIVALATNAGDYIHCIAASVLAQHRLSHPSSEHAFYQRPLVICILDFNGPPPADRKLGDKAFKYCASVGVPCMVAAMAVKPDAGAKDPYMRFLKGELLTELWNKQRELWVKAQNGGPVPTYSSIRDDVNLTNMEQGKESTTQDNLVTFTEATTIIMQLVKYFGTRVAQTIMSERLVSAQQPFSPEVAMKAMAAPDKKQTDYLNQSVLRFNALRQAIEKAKASSKKKRVLLVNYRCAYYYPQHNCNSPMIAQIKKLAAEHDAVVIVIPAILPKILQERKIELGQDVFWIYDPPADPVTHEQPYANDLPDEGRAYFWSLVARYLQIPPVDYKREEDDFTHSGDACVIGLLGGRSGSMDIASFAGMRCLSFDEPLFGAIGTDKVYPGSDKDNTKYTTNRIPWPPQWYEGQAHQVLRLLNQRDLMHVSFLKASTVDLSVKGERTYSELDETDIRLKWFLDEKNITLAEKPPVSLGHPAFENWSVFVIAFGRIRCERKEKTKFLQADPVPKIFGANFDAYSLLAQWTLEGKAEAEKVVNALPINDAYAPNTKYTGK